MTRYSNAAGNPTVPPNNCTARNSATTCPVFPGVLILEAMAQSLAILAFATSGGYPEDNKLYLFVGIDEARFKRQVQPGDQLVIDIQLLRLKKGFGKFRCTASVDGEVVFQNPINQQKRITMREVL